DADLAEGAYQANNYNYAMNFKRELFSYGAAYKFNSKLSIQFNGGYSQMRRYAQKDSSIDDNAGDYDHTYFFDLYKGTTLTNELQANYTTKGFDIVAGGGLFDETMASDNYYYDAGYLSQGNLDTLKINVLTKDVFIHTDIDGSLINDKFKAFSLALGYRYTYHQLFGSNSTFEINPSYRIAPNTLLYGSYSTGFNAPSLYQLYAPDITPPLNVTIGNKDLKPETSKSWEAGIKYSPTAGTTFTASYFFTEIDNTVEFVYLWNKNKPVDSLSYFDYLGDTYLNLGKQSTQGFEFSVSAAIGKKLLFEGNVSIMGGKLEYSPTSIDTAKTHGNYVQLFDNGQFLTNKSFTVLGLTRRPNTANFSLTYRFCDKMSLRMDARYVGSNNDICYNNGVAYMGAEGTVGIEDYALMDLSLKYTIFKNFTAIAKCENVFNKKYVEIYGFTTKGRGIYLSLRYAF
ncbi:MAG: TonB-dependent receptor, partial [Bacteroidales bacterium]